MMCPQGGDLVLVDIAMRAELRIILPFGFVWLVDREIGDYNTDGKIEHDIECTSARRVVHPIHATTI